MHIPDVLVVPGIRAATRYRLLAKPGATAGDAFQYMAVYELEADDLRGVFRSLVFRIGTPLMPMSGAMAEERAFYAWQALTPRRWAQGAPVPGSILEIPKECE